MKMSESSLSCFGAGKECQGRLGEVTRVLASLLQFERTLIVVEEGGYVSYLEGCTAPAYDENQLHAAVVELSAAKDAEIKYSTVQNW